VFGKTGGLPVGFQTVRLVAERRHVLGDEGKGVLQTVAQNGLVWNALSGRVVDDVL
jgi:hypothetical protein